MGIVHIKTWAKRRRTGKGGGGSPLRRGKTTGLRVERNQEGVLFFRQPYGPNNLVTWHIHTSGEPLLRQNGVVEGGILPEGVFRRLYREGHLFTGRGNHSSGAATTTKKKTPKSAPQTSGVKIEQTASGRVLTVYRPPQGTLGLDARREKPRQKSNPKNKGAR